MFTLLQKKEGWVHSSAWCPCGAAGRQGSVLTGHLMETKVSAQKALGLGTSQLRAALARGEYGTSKCLGHFWGRSLMPTPIWPGAGHYPGRRWVCCCRCLPSHASLSEMWRCLAVFTARATSSLHGDDAG